jgi:hypothetical protein
MTAMGARFNSAVTGICISKQQWLYKEELVDDGQGGQRSEITLDRPDILLFPSENVLFDPNCDWTAPAQTAAYLILKYPMNIGDARTLIKSNVGDRGTNVPWRSVSDADLRSAVASPAETTGVRASRSGGKDP